MVYWSFRVIREMRYLRHTVCILEDLPVYSGKHIVREDFLIFSSNRSFLLRKRMIDVSVNHLLLQIESNNFKLSCIRFCKRKNNTWNMMHICNRIKHRILFNEIASMIWNNLYDQMASSSLTQYELTVVSSSCRTWSYSLIATQNIMAVTSSKQWIHFFRSDLCPPTSNNLQREIQGMFTSCRPITCLTMNLWSLAS